MEVYSDDDTNPNTPDLPADSMALRFVPSIAPPMPGGTSSGFAQLPQVGTLSGSARCLQARVDGASAQTDTAGSSALPVTCRAAEDNADTTWADPATSSELSASSACQRSAAPGYIASPAPPAFATAADFGSSSELSAWSLTADVGMESICVRKCSRVTVKEISPARVVVFY
eukprot:TRINITY_DN42397_c0_g2_i2.p1 TRINITY_DN42397_c0_g2~~TRINITY_DN42397_c0_g2_i2.p1  ORF type:complete len:172 (+),score=4.51 TRINITY_DN42397_c0_g2_i2:116-631(+)